MEFPAHVYQKDKVGKRTSLWCSVVLGSILFVLWIQPLSNLIKRHSLSVRLFADDIKVETSNHPQHVHSAVSSVKTCISDVKYWMIENKLQLNDEKTDVVVVVVDPTPPTCCQQSPVLFVNVRSQVKATFRHCFLIRRHLLIATCCNKCQL